VATSRSSGRVQYHIPKFCTLCSIRWDVRTRMKLQRHVKFDIYNWCVLLCFIQPILGNRYVRSRGFIVSEPRETHPRSEIADVQTSPCPPLDNLGCPDPHPPPWLHRWLHWSPPLTLRTDLQLLRWQPGACALAALLSGQVQSLFSLIGEGTEPW